MSRTWVDKLKEKMPRPGPGEDGVHVVDVDYALAWVVWHEYRDHFPWTKAEYAELIRPYFKVGDTTSEVINRLWEDRLVEPSYREGYRGRVGSLS